MRGLFFDCARVEFSAQAPQVSIVTPPNKQQTIYGIIRFSKCFGSKQPSIA